MHPRWCHGFRFASGRLLQTAQDSPVTCDNCAGSESAVSSRLLRLYRMRGLW